MDKNFTQLIESFLANAERDIQAARSDFASGMDLSALKQIKRAIEDLTDARDMMTDAK